LYAAIVGAFYGSEANGLATQVLCTLWSLIAARKYQLPMFDAHMREAVGLFNFKLIKTVLSKPTLEEALTFFKANRIPVVVGDAVTGKEEPGTVVIVPPFRDGEREICFHAITVSPRTEWYPQPISGSSMQSFLTAYNKIRPSSESELAALQAEIEHNRIDTPRPYSVITPGDASLAVSAVLANTIVDKKSLPVAYEIVNALKKGEKRKWILAVRDGLWSAVETDQDKEWKVGDIWKPVYANVKPVDKDQRIRIVKEEKLEGKIEKPENEYFEEETAAPTDEPTSYSLKDCLFSGQKKPGKQWALSRGKVVNIDLQFKLGKVGLEIIRSIYPKEVSYAEKHPFAGYFVETYGHPTLRYLVNHLVLQCFSNVYRHQNCFEAQKPALVADCGSKYHQLVNMLPHSEYELHAYRPEIFTYDVVYNRERSKLLPPSWKLYSRKVEDAWSEHLNLPVGADLVAVDTIYYPGVRACITAHLHRNPDSVAHVVFTAYAQLPGHYSYIDGEGSYCVYEKDAEHPSFLGKKKELWVRNMPNKNERYEHRLFDYSPYASQDAADCNGIAWKEVCSYHIGNQARLVYVQLRSVDNRATIDPKVNFDRPVSDEVSDRHFFNEELYGQALAYFEFKKLEKITASDRLSAACYVHSKAQIFVVSDMQQEMTHRNVLYAAFDWIRRVEENKEKARLATLLEKRPVERFLRAQWQALMVRLPNIYTIEWYLGAFVAVWLILHAAMPYYHILHLLVIILASLCLQPWAAQATIWVFEACYPFWQCIFWLLYCFAAGFIICLALAIRRKYHQQPKRHASMNEYHRFHNLVSGIQLRDLTPDQWADLKTPFNKSLKIVGTLASVLKLAQDAVTHFTVPRFVHSGFEFTSEFVRTTPSMMKKTVVNTLHALFVRQCGHYHRPEKVIVRKFLKFSQHIIDTEIAPKILTQLTEYNIHQHLSKYETAKREDYKKHWNQFMEDFGVKHTAECMQKSNELNYGETAKPRFLFNPSGSVKVLGTYMNAYYLDRLKGEDWLGIGLNTGELCDKLERIRLPIADSIPVTWDGSNHDGHQYEELIDGIDGYLFKKTFHHVLPYLVSLPPGLYDQYMKILTASSTKFWISYKRQGTYLRMVNGKIKGTTFSGHPTRTTLGNSLRVYLYSRFVSARAGIKTSVMVAGDDVICFVGRQDLGRFRKAFDRLYIDGSVVQPKDKCTHGLGQVAKDYKENYDQTFEFLSKYGMVYHGRVILNRRIERALLSGNDTCKVNRKFTKAHFNWAITTSLASWARGWPVVKNYITARTQSLVHWVPQAWQRLSKTLRKALVDVMGYKFLTQVNHYDYTPVSDAFYLMFNPRILTLMEEDVRFAPQYFVDLYDRAPMKKSSFNESTKTKSTTKTNSTSTAPTSNAKRRQNSKAAGAA